MKYFGTDGVRGKAGEFPLLPETMTSLGRAIGLKSKGPVIIGRDTRESGEWMLHALTAGILSAGSDVWDLGVCPTPTVARVTSAKNKGLGLVISASHNLAEDNGVKIFRPDGRKSSAAMEQYFESALTETLKPKASKAAANYFDKSELVQDELTKLLKKFSKLDLNGLHVAIDTANGALFELAPEALLNLGASIVQLGASPNGKNINKGCGSLHLKQLSKVVKKHGCDVGFAFDGDADRCLAVNANGDLLDGDALLAILAQKHLTKRSNKSLTGTVMTNQGLEDHLKSKGIKLFRTPVGDKYVVEKMRRSGSPLGGENSGHIIISKRGYVGDGLLTMLSVLEVLAKFDFDMTKALEGYTQYPQVLINIPVKHKKPFESIPSIKKAAAAAEKLLKGQGRLLLRYSGTENLARVMVEAKSARLAQETAKELAKLFREVLGK